MEIAIIFFLTLLNGFFALSEIALVSVKKSRIEHLAAKGNKRAVIVLKLLENPEHFLSSVQVGITLIGIISGAYGGVTLTDDLEAILTQYSFLHPYAHWVSLIFVIGGITYFSIVIGELVPKTIAMNNSERIALFCVPLIKSFTRLTFPFVKLLSVSTQVILKASGIKQSSAEQVSEEELRFMLKNARKQGVIEREENEVHQNLFSFTDQTAKSLMTHRTQVEWVNINSSKKEIFDKLKESIHSKFIVCNDSLDAVVGMIALRDFFENYRLDDFNLNQIVQAPIFIIQNTPAFKILNLFKRKKQYLAVVVDEFGGTKGIVTLHDLTEAIIGNLPEMDEEEKLRIVKRDNNSFLIDASMLVYEINQHFDMNLIEVNNERYTTLAGFLIAQLQTMPKTTHKVVHNGYEFEIIDMDGVRIDKVMMTKK